MISFEIKLQEKIELDIGENKKIVEKIEIRKPVSKYRNYYSDFYQEITRSLISVKPPEQDSQEINKNKKKKDKDKFDQDIAIAIGSMHMSNSIIKKLFDFLDIGDKESPTCLILGEKVDQLELDLLKDKLDDIDIAAMLGGIILNFLPLMQLNKD